ncbi:FAD-binding protein [candidate division KSB1 bacterium]
MSNWGNYPVIDAHIRSFGSENELSILLERPEDMIPRGLGRCYGDSSLNSTIVSTHRFNRIRAFDEQTGTITCESGVSLREITDIFIPRGWFLPTTPGTKQVTVGGAIASDVHGKNHHGASSFSRHVAEMDVMLSDGKAVTCSRDENSELFWSTCGGMGLTGVILNASFQLQPVETAFIKSETIKTRSLDEIFVLFEASAGWTYSVAWMDLTSTGKNRGRAVLNRGDHASLSDLVTTKYYRKHLAPTTKRQLPVPFFLPGFTLNKYSVALFNTLYYTRSSGRTSKSIIDIDSFFYPLDSLADWNRIYGTRGFTQYQFALPKESSKAGLGNVLKKMESGGPGPFLSVLKLFGKQEGILSFPMEGYTLAMDFPVSEKTFKLLDELDRIVLDHGGRLYLTKDARMSGHVFRKGYENADLFIAHKYKFDKINKFQSLQSQRIGV